MTELLSVYCGGGSDADDDHPEVLVAVFDLAVLRRHARGLGPLSFSGDEFLGNGRAYAQGVVGGAYRIRYRLECPEPTCVARNTLELKAEVLLPVAENLLTHGVARVSMHGLERRVVT